MKLTKGHKVEYFGAVPYVLAYGNSIEPGEEFEVLEDVNTSSDNFKCLGEPINMDKLHEKALEENEKFDHEKEQAEKVAKAKVEAAKKTADNKGK